MARTPAFAVLRDALRTALSRERGLDPQHSLRRLGRRSFARQSASLLAAGALAPWLDACKRDGPRIAVVGAGLAGLSCAYRLRRAGVHCTVYDAQARVGGRVWTAYGKFRDGLYGELGAEFIDTEHETLRRLCRELRLVLDDLAAPPNNTDTRLYFGGRLLSEAELVEAYRPLAAQIRADLALARRDPSAFARLDRMSLAGWLEAQRELDATLRSVLSVAYLGEYGLEPEEQSVFNLFWQIDADTPEPFRPLGSSDERYRVRGGNSRIAAALAERVRDQLELEQRLLRVTQRADDSFQLTFERHGGTRELRCDVLALALPFSLLRRVELELPLPATKRRVIAELGYGTNAKLIGQYAERTWLTRHATSGGALTDLPVQTTWDASRAQPGLSGLLTVFLGGHQGAELDRGTPEARARGFSRNIDAIFAGTEAAYVTDSALRMHWPTLPHALGSYACYRPGQAAWSGVESARVGHVHFCGEHTSTQFQGFMEGAAESGERVAQEILSDLRRV